MITNSKTGVLKFPKATHEPEKKIKINRRKGSMPPPKMAMPDINSKFNFIDIGGSP